MTCEIGGLSYLSNDSHLSKWGYIVLSQHTLGCISVYHQLSQNIMHSNCNWYTNYNNIMLLLLFLLCRKPRVVWTRVLQRFWLVNMIQINNLNSENFFFNWGHISVGGLRSRELGQSPFRRILTPWIFHPVHMICHWMDRFWCSLQKHTSTKFHQLALLGITVLCLDLTHPSSEINKLGIERDLDWFAYDA